MTRRLHAEFIQQNQRPEGVRPGKMLAAKGLVRPLTIRIF